MPGHRAARAQRHRHRRSRHAAAHQRVGARHLRPLAPARALHSDPEQVLRLSRELEFNSMVDGLPRTADAGVAAPAMSPAPAATAQDGAGSSDANGHASGDVSQADRVQLSLFEEAEMESLAEQGTDLPAL